MFVRFLLWRLLGVLATAGAIGAGAWLLEGGIGRALRQGRPDPRLRVRGLPADPHPLSWLGALAPAIALVLVVAAGATGIIGAARWHARRRRAYVRLRVVPYRTDCASAEAIVGMYESLHKRLLRRWWRRLFFGQPSLALEVHAAAAHGESGAPAFTVRERERRAPMASRVWLEVACPVELQGMVQAALRSAYPNTRLSPSTTEVGDPPAVVRLKKHAEFIKRVKIADHFEHEREPAMNRLMNAISAAGGAAFVQIALTPTPASFEQHAKHLYKRHEARLARERRAGERVVRDRSLLDDGELRGGLDVQHRPLFFTDVRIVAGARETCERIASELRAAGAENHLVERGTALRHGVLGLYRRRVRRGEGNPWPSWHKGVWASTELAALWHLPSVGYLTVPFARAPVALAPAPPGVLRPSAGAGTLVDALGPVTLHPQMRRQNTAVPGTVEQGKTSYLVATVAEDLRREDCAVIVLDPKGDAAEAAVSLVAPERTCTLLDLAHPTCGFNPLAVQAPADTIADYVVGALKHLFTDSDIRASSDRYLRNAIIAVLAYDREGTLWDAARLLSVGEEGYAYRARVGARVRELPEFKEISEFFTAELAAQLADARSMTTAKLDAPVNKLARLLNSPSIKRVLLNDSLRIDFDRLIGAREVLVVRGALGAMGAGNTSVLMQLLVGMLDAALARQQDLVAVERRVSVALKVDEAPLVLNRGFAETMALKRSAGLETVACWQTEAQWTEREVRDQLDALFAHRVYFATASVAGCARVGEPRDGGVLRRGAPRGEPLRARQSRCAAASAQAPRDRELEHARGSPASVHGTDDSRCRSIASGSRSTRRGRPSAADAIWRISHNLTGIDARLRVRSERANDRSTTARGQTGGEGAARAGRDRARSAAGEAPRAFDAPGIAQRTTGAEGMAGAAWRGCARGTGCEASPRRARGGAVASPPRATASLSLSTGPTASAGPGLAIRHSVWNPIAWTSRSSR